LIISLSGYSITAWAVLTNRFFSSAVRLQPDRQQVVIDTGPYAYLRHPGYSGAIPYMILGPLALSSWLSTILGGIPLLIIIFRRIILEDAMLRSGLPGYAEYAARVKYRLIPGIW
jgi:protein-S-isoprenylcysteine O-methyltransferase Ste14